MRPFATASALALAMAGAPGAAGAQCVPAAAVVDLGRIGPQIGEAVPPFALPDQDGRIRTLESIIGPKGAMLVFFRSAGW